jgi:hypothetical protein
MPSLMRWLMRRLMPSLMRRLMRWRLADGVHRARRRTRIDVNPP